MRLARSRWVAEGKLRGNDHLSYRNYKHAQSLFRSYHRKCAEKYLSDLNAETDQTAEVDSAYFWKKVNGRRKLSTACAESEIEFNGRIFRDIEEISAAWCSYFEDLSSNSNREHFDPLFQNIVDTKVGDILRDLSYIA